MSRSLAEIYPQAFVTGVSGGLGRAFAELLLHEGVRVWGTARDAARLTDLAAKFPALFTPVVLDLSAPEAAAAAFKRAASSASGAFDLVVNNAGYGVFGAFESVDAAVWQKQLEAMLGTTLRLTHAALSGMRPRDRGCIVNVSSLAAEFPLPFMSGYNVVKAGLSALSESLIIETKGTGIKVIDFRPGDFRTDFNQAMLTSSSVVTAANPAAATAWRAIDAHLQASAPPAAAARDLRKALMRQRSGMVRSGSLFQASIAPVIAALVPTVVRRAILTRYYGI